MKKTTLALGMHDKLFKRARTMYRIEHRICDLLMTKGTSLNGMRYKSAHTL